MKKKTRLKLKIETIKKLEDLKNNLGYDIYKNYCDILNICICFDNESQDNLYLYNYVQDYYNFVDYYMLRDMISMHIDDLQYCKFMLQDINTDNEIFKIDGYGWAENVDNDDIESMIDYALDLLKESEDI